MSPDVLMRDSYVGEGFHVTCGTLIIPIGELKFELHLQRGALNSLYGLTNGDLD